MKKILLAIVLILIWIGVGVAAESVVQTFQELDKDVKVLTYTITSASGGTITTANGYISTTYLSQVMGMYLYSVETNPGATAPTDDYDVYVYDEDGLDMCAGEADNRDTSNTEIAYCTTSTQPYSVVKDRIRLAVSAAGDSKLTVVKLTFVR